MLCTHNITFGVRSVLDDKRNIHSYVHSHRSSTEIIFALALAVGIAVYFIFRAQTYSSVRKGALTARGAASKIK